MANLPPPLSMKSVALSGASSPSSSSNNDRKLSSAEQLILDLSNPELRENALHELSKKREIFQDLAPLLWHSVGTIPALLQEIIAVYPALSPPTMTLLNLTGCAMHLLFFSVLLLILIRECCS
ncbi:hypothetical protein AXX17_AT2G04250 [Arabidopsis thaliana]|uniref:Uncharacterized protein n=1 Tax=Arabidopsis thaliana TaxID=3702 RepID=A0A178VSV1_ARATH|nr:hypothetical protein AXX17_AT2G04250 [Arabidopsis thaliana]